MAFGHACLAHRGVSACWCFPSACRVLFLLLDPAQPIAGFRSAQEPVPRRFHRLRAGKASLLAFRHVRMGEGRTCGWRGVRDRRGVQEVHGNSGHGIWGRNGAWAGVVAARRVRTSRLFLWRGLREVGVAHRGRRSRRYGERRCVWLRVRYGTRPKPARVASRACTSQLRATQARAATARVSPKSFAARKLLSTLLAAVRARVHRRVLCVKNVNVLCLDSCTSTLHLRSLWQSSPRKRSYLQKSNQK